MYKKGGYNINIPQELQYAGSHEWVRFEGTRAVVGISDFGQSQLGDIMVFELPIIGNLVQVGLPFAVVESVKAVTSLFAPVSGVIVAVNDRLEDVPENANHDPYGEGWIIVIEVAGEERGELLDSVAYAKLVESQ